jgi:hypothetical protein
VSDLLDEYGAGACGLTEAAFDEMVTRDPTSERPVGEEHVAVRRGRDYSDVPPLKRVYVGSADHDRSVAVRMTRTS